MDKRSFVTLLRWLVTEFVVPFLVPNLEMVLVRWISTQIQELKRRVKVWLTKPH